MKKRLISLVLSVVTTLSAVSAINVTALDYYWGTTNNEAFSDCIEIEDYSWLPHPHKDKTIAMYLDSVNSFPLIYDVTTAHDSIVITVPINEDILKIEDSLKGINENLFFSSATEPNKNFIYCNITSEKISMENVKKIRELFGEKAIDFTYKFNQLYYQKGHINYMTMYYNTEENTEKIKEFVENNNIDAEVVLYPYIDGDVNSNSIRVVPKKELTLSEHFELAKEIYDATGLTIKIAYPETLNEPIGTTLDLTNYLNGDSNCDKKQTIADAVAILQFLGNPDDYPLSELGAFNADSDCNGITADDAVRIQQKDAGIL